KPRPERRRRRRVLSPVRIAAVGLAAAAACAAVLTLGGGSPTPRALHVDTASAAPLVRLSAKVRQSPQPPGDATLVLRTQTYPDQPTITGADLYVDDGPYYYSPTRDGLPAVIASHSDSGGAQMKRELDAAVAALTLPIDEGRRRMADAALDP